MNNFNNVNNVKMLMKRLMSIIYKMLMAYIVSKKSSLLQRSFMYQNYRLFSKKYFLIEYDYVENAYYKRSNFINVLREIL